MNVEEHLHTLDRATLTGIVRRALGSADVEVIDWDIRPLVLPEASSNPTSGGVYRVAGRAGDGGVEQDWSLVVKVLKSPAGTVVPGGFVIPIEQAEDPSRFSYWGREHQAFESGLLADLPSAIVAPRYFGSLKRSDQSIWLWLEEIEDHAPPQWAPDHYAQAARHLGAFNGHYLQASQVSSDSWLSRGWLRSWLETAIAGHIPVLEDASAWAQPSLRLAFPEPVQERLLQLWADRELFLAALARLPQTFCHLDAYRGNLFIQRQAAAPEHIVALDWSFAGIAALGEELSALIVGTALVGHVDVATLRVAEQQAFAGYLAGLNQVGWAGDPTLVRLGYVASATLRYAFLAAGTPLLGLLDPGYADAAQRQSGRSWADIQTQRGSLAIYLLDLADEARALIGGDPGAAEVVAAAMPIHP